MPRLADHDERRAHILDALLRIAASRGLHAASMRTVAAEAGVTVSTVQHYFQDKERLLYAGLERLSVRVGERALRSVAGDGPRAVVRAWLGQFIPVDAEQRAAYTVFAAYHALALTDDRLARLPYGRRTGALERTLAGNLIGSCNDPDAAAAIALALATGLGDSVMAGIRTPEAALALLERHLDDVLGGDVA
ncbi:TetR family transcriptional regulator [Actinoplanes sp. NBRC 101535]|uniref:TetR/AcrR family transcriptional regulator n=1 Tax=Actinoplanes sp. NBRC 101535 TaxID=3032196 RepID=UPI0024A37162|nr:TetR family transcriptional regulator [Actinoplanes sp. NBRC 101535]GLY04515.1 hypothetical protein Acsp01_48940 [Actinoplanes sp. NBRC 101535]